MYSIKTLRAGQRHRKPGAELLFERYPDQNTAYELSSGLSYIFENTKGKVFGLANLAKWQEKVFQSGLKALNTIFW